MCVFVSAFTVGPFIYYFISEYSYSSIVLVQIGYVFPCHANLYLYSFIAVVVKLVLIMYTLEIFFNQVPLTNLGRKKKRGTIQCCAISV